MTVGGIKEKRRRRADNRSAEAGEPAGRNQVGLAAGRTVDARRRERVGVIAIGESDGHAVEGVGEQRLRGTSGAVVGSDGDKDVVARYRKVEPTQRVIIVDGTAE